jgi:hypothetical protein
MNFLIGLLLPVICFAAAIYVIIQLFRFVVNIYRGD